MIAGVAQAGARSAVTALTIVVNDRASSAPTPHALTGLVHACVRTGAQARVVRTRSLDELAAVWNEDDGSRIVLVGGDGSVHAAANLAGRSRDVALIPAGRANNIARCLGVPLDPIAAVQLAVHGAVRPLNALEAIAAGRRRVVLEGLSAGFLAEARSHYHGRNSADLREALRAGLGALARFRPYAVRVCGGRDSEELELAQLFVANLPRYGFGLQVAPHADPLDAVVDVVGLEARTRSDVVRMLVGLRRDGLFARPGVHLWRCHRLTVRCATDAPVVADTETLEGGVVDVRVLPAALRVVRP